MGSIPKSSSIKGPHYPRSQVSGKRVCELFSQNANLHPESIALYYDENEDGTMKEKMTMEELENESNGLARILANYYSHSAKPNRDGDRVVLIYLPPSKRLLSCILAVWKLGATFVPVEPPAILDRVHYIIKEVKPFLVISDFEENHPLFAGVENVSYDQLVTIGMKDSIRTYPLTNDEKFLTKEDHIEMILFTSGSTGVPKGVRLLRSSIMNRIEWQWNTYPFRKEEKACCFKTSITFVDAIAELWAPLAHPDAPLSIVILKKETVVNFSRLVGYLELFEIGRLTVVPTLLKGILTYFKISGDTKSLSKMKLWICSGETLHCKMVEEFFSWVDKMNFRSVNLCNFYGSTEVMGDVTYYTISETMYKDEGPKEQIKIPIGYPIYNTIVYLLDTHMKIVEAGKIGEIYIAGKNVAAGYVNNRDSFRFLHNPHSTDPDHKVLFKTGDYARFADNNALIFEGRTDSQIKVRGVKIDLSEIEATLNKLYKVQKAVVLCYKPGHEEKQAVVAFIVANKDQNLIDIQDDARSNLSEAAYPLIMLMDALPLLPNGKVDRQKLLSIYEDKHAQFTFPVIEDFELDVYPKEKRYAARALYEAIKMQIISVSSSNLSPNANFYEIGGNSLNSVLIISQLNDMGYKISITDFIRSKTLNEIIDKIVTRSNSLTESVLDKYQFELIEEKHKEDVYRIIGDSFYNKADIELTMEPPIERHEYNELMAALWPKLVKHKLSIVLRDPKTAEVISTSLAYDAADEPAVDLESRLKYVFELLESIESPIMEDLMKRGKILHSFMLGTDQKLTPQENVEVAEAMERKLEQIAKDNRFYGIFSTNTNPLTQQLSMRVLNYKLMKEYQINQFVASDGTLPFKKGDDKLVVNSVFKRIN